ncbi:MAG: PA14 domain-containing protein [Vicinamibacterales bacterium]
MRRAGALIWVTVVCGVLATALAGLSVLFTAEAGFNAEYFASLASDASPVLRTRDATLTTRHIDERWPGLAPDTFRVRWTGYLGIDADDDYAFTVTADDGASLIIDGTTVVETGAGRGTFTARGQTHLTPGLHTVVMELRQQGGDFAFDWTWARGGTEPAPVPKWRLVSRRGAWPLQQRAPACELSATIAGALFLGLLAISQRQRWAATARRHQVAALLVFFVLMAVVQTWPLASDPGHLSRNDNADTVLNEWALAWVAHQAVTDPLHLFDANIFHPERYTLAYSESMIVQSAMAAPLLWLGASPVLAYNLVLIAGFALNGFVMAWILRRWTGRCDAALVGGMLFAYNAHIFTRLPHMQALHVEFLPLGLYAWDHLLRTPRWKHAVAFGLMCALQALTSVYLLVFTLCAMTAAAIARAPEWLGARLPRMVPLLLVSVVVAAAVATPFLWPYLWVHQAYGFERSLDDTTGLAASLASYLSSPSRLHYGLWSHKWFGESSALFPGVTAMCLAALALVRGTAFRDARARMCLAMGITGVLLSFGAHIPGFAWLFAHVAFLRVVRVVSSYGYLGLVGLAVVAAYGVIELSRMVPTRAWALTLTSVVVLVTLEPMAAPLELSPFDGTRRIYDRLRGETSGVVIELPFYTESAGFAQARYMLNSTRHWRPMLNGYSGYRPPSYYATADAVSSFPSPQSLAWLADHGVTHVFVNLGAYDEEMPHRIEASGRLRALSTDRGTTLYQLDAMK